MLLHYRGVINYKLVSALAAVWRRPSVLPSTSLVLRKVPTMVHIRLNERETNPNPHINFISVLDAEEENARQLIRALAAQVKPVMKAHGFTVNSLEEVSERICSATILKLIYSRLV